ncbi:MAG: hypothetical protein RRA92_09800 [Gemmatimonadota bacterium]|nr:hypothetical protein [Gemmatimonadota bacterium]
MTTRTAGVPERLRRYFWDVDPDRLSWETGRAAIIRRLLNSGGMDAIAWLRFRVSDEDLREFVLQRDGCGLSPRRLRFWGLVLDIPADLVDAWVADARRNPWYRRTS